MKAGSSLMKAIFNLFEIVWKNETIPDGWMESLLIQLYKGSGPKSCLDNLRFIHMKESPVPKLFEQIVLSAAKENLFKNMSKFQIATKPCHRSSEHLFVIFSLISLYEKEGKGLIISMFDLSKFCACQDFYDLYK